MDKRKNNEKLTDNIIEWLFNSCMIEESTVYIFGKEPFKLHCSEKLKQITKEHSYELQYIREPRSEDEIIFKNGSRIKIKTASMGARGIATNYLLLDSSVDEELKYCFRSRVFPTTYEMDNDVYVDLSTRCFTVDFC